MRGLDPYKGRVPTLRYWRGLGLCWSLFRYCRCFLYYWNFLNNLFCWCRCFCNWSCWLFLLNVLGEVLLRDNTNLLACNDAFSKEKVMKRWRELCTLTHPLL